MKKLALLTLILSVGLISGCGKKKYEKGETKTFTINVVVNSGASYTYDFGNLDDDKAIIYAQASHASSTSLGQNSGSSNTQFVYTPEGSYSGSDEVRIKIYDAEDEKGSSGSGHCQGQQDDDDTEIYIFKITVNGTNSNN